MQVRCDNCGATYEMDESQIPQGGLAVQCSACQAVFVARKPRNSPTMVAPVVLEQRVDNTPRFKLRRPDGKVYPFREMATLHRWVVERKAFSLDEMTEDGVTWIKLEEIAELEPFFKAVQVQGTGQFRKEAETTTDIASNFDADQDTEITPVRLPSMSRVPSTEDPNTLVNYQGVQPKEDQPQQPQQPQRPRMATAPQGGSYQPPQPHVMAPSGDAQPRTTLPGVAPVAPEPVAPQPVAPQPVQTQPQQPVAPQPVQTQPQQPVAPQPVQTQTQQPVAPQPAPQQPVQTQPQQPVAQQPVQTAQTPAVSPSASTTGNAMSAAASPQDDEEFWDEYERMKGGKKKWIIAFLIIAIAGGLGTWYGMDQRSFKNTFSFIMGPAVDPVAQSKVSQARQWYLLGDNGNLTKAAAACDTAISLSPDYIDAYAAKAEVLALQAMGNDIIARHYKAQYDDLRSKISAAGKDTATVNALTAKANVLTPIINEAIKLSNEGSTAAQEAANKAYTLAGGMDDVAVVSAFVHLDVATGITADARRYLDKMEQMPGRDAAIAGFMRGVLQLNDGSESAINGAVQLLGQAAQRKAGFEAPKFFLAVAQLKQNKTNDAIKTLKSLVAANSEHAMAVRLLGDLKPVEEAAPAPKEEAKAVKKAAPKAEAAPKAPADVKSLLAKAKRLRLSDKASQALKYANKALAAEPDNVKANVEAGFCLVDMERISKAIKRFTKAKKLDGGSADAMLGLATCYEINEEPSRAVRYYKKFLRLCPNCEDAPAAKNYINQHKDD